jgi:hypothetical protein
MSFPLFNNQGFRKDLSGGSFSPDDLSNLLVWHKETGIQSTGSDITQWDDESGNGWHASTGANYPQTGQTRNSLAVVDFQTSDWLDWSSAFPAEMAADNVTGFIVASRDTAGTGLVFHTGRFGDIDWALSWGNGTDAYRYRHNLDQTYIESNSGNGAGGWDLITFYRDGVTRSININQGTAVTDTGAGNTSTDTSSNMEARLGPRS